MRCLVHAQFGGVARVQFQSQIGSLEQNWGHPHRTNVTAFSSPHLTVDVRPHLTKLHYHCEQHCLGAGLHQDPEGLGQSIDVWHLELIWFCSSLFCCSYFFPTVVAADAALLMMINVSAGQAAFCF